MSDLAFTTTLPDDLIARLTEEIQKRLLPPKTMLEKEQAAAYFGHDSVRTLEGWQKKGCPFHKPDAHHVYFDVREVEDWLQGSGSNDLLLTRTTSGTYAPGVNEMAPAEQQLPEARPKEVETP